MNRKSIRDKIHIEIFAKGIVYWAEKGGVLSGPMHTSHTVQTPMMIKRHP